MRESEERAAVTLVRGMSVSSAEEGVGMLQKKRQKTFTACWKQRRFGIEHEEVLDGSYKKMDIYFSSVWNK